MYPHNSESLISEKFLDSVANIRQDLERVIFWDAIFNPFKTKFLQNAEKYGTTIISGLGMMIFQGIKAFELWTGKKVDESIFPSSIS